MTQEQFRDFIDQSGLKMKFVAENVLGVPQWVIAKWLRKETMLFPLQQQKLDKFCEDYVKLMNFFYTERPSKVSG